MLKSPRKFILSVFQIIGITLRARSRKKLWRLLNQAIFSFISVVAIYKKWVGEGKVPVSEGSRKEGHQGFLVKVPGEERFPRSLHFDNG